MGLPEAEEDGAAGCMLGMTRGSAQLCTWAHLHSGSVGEGKGWRHGSSGRGDRTGCSPPVITESVLGWLSGLGGVDELGSLTHPDSHLAVVFHSSFPRWVLRSASRVALEG